MTAMIKRNQQEMRVLQENNLRYPMDDVDYRLFIERLERKQTCGFKTSAYPNDRRGCSFHIVVNPGV